MNFIQSSNINSTVRCHRCMRTLQASEVIISDNTTSIYVASSTSNNPKRSSAVHAPGTLPGLQYPLLFPKGENGWYSEMRLTETEAHQEKRLNARDRRRQDKLDHSMERLHRVGSLWKSARKYMRFIAAQPYAKNGWSGVFVRDGTDHVTLSGLAEPRRTFPPQIPIPKLTGIPETRKLTKTVGNPESKLQSYWWPSASELVSSTVIVDDWTKIKLVDVLAR